MLEIFLDKPEKKKKKKGTKWIAKLYVNLIVYNWNLLQQLTYESMTTYYQAFK